MNQENIQVDQGHNSPSDVVIIPYIEENVPLPRNSHEALPSMTNEKEVMVRATTIKELSDLTGEEIAPDAKHRLDAEEIARDMVTNPQKKQEFINYANETMAYLGGMVGTYNHMIVNDLAELKLYVVNKLVEIVQDEESNRKEQITALRSIGEVDGVDAFKKKTEVLHKVESIDEVEKELIKLLNEFKSQGLIKADPQTIEADYTMSKKDIDELQEEVKEKSFDDIVQEAVDGSTTGD
jgi:hypothetical protein